MKPPKILFAGLWLIPALLALTASAADVGNSTAGNITASAPLPAKPVGPVVAVSAGTFDTLFLTKDGGLWGMGRNAKGELGDNTKTEHSSPTLISLNVTAAALGGEITSVLLTDHSLWNMNGGATSAPVRISSSVVSLSAGSNHLLFVRTDYSLWGMGTNTSGELGGGITAARTSPAIITNNVTAVAVGADFTLILGRDKTLWGLGQDGSGQLGDGTPVPTATVTRGRAPATGTVFQNADGSRAAQLSPVLIAANVIAMAAGARHSLFIKGDGTLWAMGVNQQGQLGDGTTTLQREPVQVATDVTAVAAGAAHSLFLKKDGTLWGMGDNRGGQLGDGSTGEHDTPIQIATNVTAIAAGAGQSLFIKKDGSLWGIGGNSAGELGDDSKKNHLSPVQIVPAAPGP